MHTIPDKMNALRQAMESTQLRIAAELRRDFELKMVNAAQTAEDKAVERAIAFATAKGEEDDCNALSILEEMPRLRRQVSDLTKSCEANMDAVKKEVLAKVQELNVEVTGIRVELPPLRKHVDDNDEALRRQATFQPEVKSELSAMRDENAAAVQALTTQLEEERRRANAAEALLLKHIEENDAKACSAIEACAERSRQQAAKAMEHSGCIQDRMMSQFDDFSQKMQEDIQTQIAEVSSSLQPAIDKEIDLVMTKLSSFSSLIEGRFAMTEKELRNDFRDIVEESATAFERSTELKANELSTTIAENLDLTRAELAAVREAGKTALEEGVADFFKRLNSVRLSLDEKSQRLDVAISDGEKRLQLAAEANATKFSARHRDFEEALAELTTEGKEAREAQKTSEEQLRKDMQEQLKSETARLSHRVEDVAKQSEIQISTTVADSVGRLEQDMKMRLSDLGSIVDSVRSASKKELQDEKDERVKAMVRLHESVAASNHSNLIEYQALLDAVKAESTTRLDGMKDTVTNLAQGLSTVEADHQMFSDQLKEVAEAITDEVEKKQSEFQKKLKGFQTHLSHEKKVITEQLQADTQWLTKEISFVRETAMADVATLRGELAQYGKKEEVDHAFLSAKAALTATSETTARMHVFEAAADRHRESLEQRTKDLAVRCYDAQAESSDTKYRLQQETSTLGTELALLHGAASSLTKGVLKFMQIAGFLNDDLDSLVLDSTSGTCQSQANRAGLDVVDLLEWEKCGKGLAAHLESKWDNYQSAGVRSLLSLVEQKASDRDVRMLRASVASVERLTDNEKSIPAKDIRSSPFSSPSKPWTPSTTADDYPPHRGASNPSGFFSTSPDDDGDDFIRRPLPPAGPCSGRPNHTARPASSMN